MKITKEFIKENGDKTLKEVWPELFKVELEVGRWYKRPHNKALFYIKNITAKGNLEVYGFDVFGNWMTKEGSSEPDKEVPATNEEVSAALIAEAKRRGFEEGVYFKQKDFDHIHKIQGDRYFYHSDDNTLRINGYSLFERGKWIVTIIPKISKAEAEEKLGVKIV